MFASRWLGAAVRAPLRAAALLARVFGRRPAVDRFVASLFGVLLLATGGFGTAFQLSLKAKLPSALDWEAAGALLSRDARPGDALAVAPAWAERARAIAPPGMPVLTLRRLTGADLRGVRRVWLLSLPRAPGFTYQAELDLAAMSSAADPPQAVGHLEVARYELAHPELPLARLDQRLAQAEVRLGDRACPPSRAGFRCTLGEAEAWVEEATVEVDGLPRSCLTVRASGDAGPITIAFPALPLGRELRGNSGLLPGEGTNTSATLAVRIDGEQAGAVELDGAGWPSFEVDTTRWAGQRRPVMLELSVPEGRPLCLQAVTMP